MIAAGYGNLIQHVDKVHLDIEVRMELNAREISSLSGGGPLVSSGFIDLRVTNLFRWIKFIINKGLPFNVVEDPEYREVVKMQGISRNTLNKYLNVIVNDVHSQIKDIVSTKKDLRFGLKLRKYSYYARNPSSSPFFEKRRPRCSSNTC